MCIHLPNTDGKPSHCITEVKLNFFIFCRSSFRHISSVIPETDLKAANDFSIKNEPILGYLPGSRVSMEAQ